MNKSENNFSTDDIQNFKRKIREKKAFTFVFFILSSVSIYYFFILNGDRYIILFILLLIFFGTIYHLIYLSIRFRDDMRVGVKISKEVLVINKKIKRDPEDFKSYYIFFQGDEIHKKYEVHKADYDTIKIGSKIHIEYTKFGNWILKIEYNGKSIENKKNFK